MVEHELRNVHRALSDFWALWKMALTPEDKRERELTALHDRHRDLLWEFIRLRRELSPQEAPRWTLMPHAAAP